MLTLRCAQCGVTARVDTEVTTSRGAHLGDAVSPPVGWRLDTEAESTRGGGGELRALCPRHAGSAPPPEPAAEPA